ncbi:MAG: VOC family protein [Deltaproteobacteria bacterium]|nr:VOC family protein [Deltaproteobacteria bacterium]
MAKIRHVAILTKDTPRLADFYKTTFGMKEVARGQEKEGMEAIYLSDGYINLAILGDRPCRHSHRRQAGPHAPAARRSVRGISHS